MNSPAKQQGLLVVVSGPSGVGKTTITNELVKKLRAVFSVSMTTRPKTAADTEGFDYYFVDVPRFQAAIENGDLLEWAKVFDNYYGTPRQPVTDNLAAGRDVILEIDVNGGEQIKKAYPRAVTIFVLPPSEEELLHRLRHRGREDEARIQRRFAEAKREMAQAKGNHAYDHFIVNVKLDDAVQEACQIVQQYRSSVY